MEQVEFADPAGSLWHPRMTYGIMKQVFQKTGIRLWALAPLEEISDPYKMPDMVYETVREEAQERSMTPEAWRVLWENGPMMPMILAFQKAQNAFAYGPEADAKKEAQEDAARPTVPRSSGLASGGSAP